MFGTKGEKCPGNKYEYTFEKDGIILKTRSIQEFSKEQFGVVSNYIHKCFCIGRLTFRGWKISRIKYEKNIS